MNTINRLGVVGMLGAAVIASALLTLVGSHVATGTDRSSEHARVQHCIDVRDSDPAEWADGLGPAYCYRLLHENTTEAP